MRRKRKIKITSKFSAINEADADRPLHVNPGDWWVGLSSGKMCDPTAIFALIINPGQTMHREMNTFQPLTTIIPILVHGVRSQKHL